MGIDAREDSGTLQIHPQNLLLLYSVGRHCALWTLLSDQVGAEEEGQTDREKAKRLLLERTVRSLFNIEQFHCSAPI